MKKINPVLVFGILLISAGILLSSCKKDEETIVPSFVVTATTVQLQGGGDGLQFYAKCTNDDVKMTKVTISDPIGAQPITYNLNGTYFVKNELFMLEDENEAYGKTIGTWKFNFVGNRTADGASFAVDASLAVGK